MLDKNLFQLFITYNAKVEIEEIKRFTLYVSVLMSDFPFREDSSLYIQQVRTLVVNF